MSLQETLKARDNELAQELAEIEKEELIQE